MDKLIITAALTGNITLPVQTPHLPLSPQEIIDDALRAAEAGAASVHIHARDPVTGKPTTEPDVYREIAAGIKARANVIVCVTTGGVTGMTAAQRVRVVQNLKPELATFNTGSMNFSIHPIVERYKDEDYKYPWEKEFALGLKEYIFSNNFADMEYFCTAMRESGTKPELEAYDVGHIYNIRYLIRQKLLDFPIWVQFVTGVLSSACWASHSRRSAINSSTTSRRRISLATLTSISWRSGTTPDRLSPSSHSSVSRRSKANNFARSLLSQQSIVPPSWKGQSRA